MHFVHLKTSGFLRVLRTLDRIVRSNTWFIHSLLGAIRFGGMRSRLDAATVGCQTFGVSEDCDVVGDGGQIGW